MILLLTCMVGICEARAKFEPASGVYLGAYVLQDDFINNSMKIFNRLTGKKHASFFKYVGYGKKPFPKEWVQKVKEVGAVPQIALEPNWGLDKVKDDAYLHKFAADALASGVPVFLRFASEMNGNWVHYHGNPALYKYKWRLLWSVMRREAPNVAMVWAISAVEKALVGKSFPYYPGNRYVDWIGINLYSVKYHNGNPKFDATNEHPLNMLRYAYGKLKRFGKPFMVSEYGATHFAAKSVEDLARFSAIKIRQLYEGLKSLPMVKAIYYFDVNTVRNAPLSSRVNDYSLTNDVRLLSVYQEVIRSDYFLSNVKRW